MAHWTHEIGRGPYLAAFKETVRAVIEMAANGVGDQTQLLSYGLFGFHNYLPSLRIPRYLTVALWDAESAAPAVLPTNSPFLNTFLT